MLSLRAIAAAEEEAASRAEAYAQQEPGQMEQSPEQARAHVADAQLAQVCYPVSVMLAYRVVRNVC